MKYKNGDFLSKMFIKSVIVHISNIILKLENEEICLNIV